MAMFLLVLKWIGIVLLAIVSILLITILYVLCLPCHYVAHGENALDKEALFSFSAKGFIHFWQVKFEPLDGNYELAVYAFWGLWRIFPRREKPEKTKNTQELTEQSILTEEDIEDILLDREVDYQPTVDEMESSSDNKKKKSDSQNQKKKNKKSKNASKKSKKQDSKWKNFHKNIKDEHNKNAVLYIIKKVLWILKKSKPTIIKADVDYSLGDPALTGVATGVISLCPGCYGKHTEIYPDFTSDEIYVYGWFDIKGIVFLVHIVYLIVSVYFNRDSKKLLQIL